MSQNPYLAPLTLHAPSPQEAEPLAPLRLLRCSSAYQAALAMLTVRVFSEVAMYFLGSHAQRGRLVVGIDWEYAAVYLMLSGISALAMMYLVGLRYGWLRGIGVMIAALLPCLGLFFQAFTLGIVGRRLLRDGIRMKWGVVPRVELRRLKAEVDASPVVA